MKTNALKISTIALLMIFIGAGVCLADGWKGEGCGHPGLAYGYHDWKGHPNWHGPRYVYHERCYYPIVVERHYYREPVRYAEPGGFFFGFTMAEPGMSIGIGVGGR